MVYSVNWGLRIVMDEYKFILELSTKAIDPLRESIINLTNVSAELKSLLERQHDYCLRQPPRQAVLDSIANHNLGCQARMDSVDERDARRAKDLTDSAMKEVIAARDASIAVKNLFNKVIWIAAIISAIGGACVGYLIYVLEHLPPG